MSVKVTMLRHVIPGREEELKELVLKMRTIALRQPGYVSGQTLVLASDPSVHLIIGQWLTLEAWRDREFQPDRIEMLDRINALLTTPSRPQVWLDAGAGIPGPI